MTAPFLWELSPQVHLNQTKTKGTHWTGSIEGATEETATAAKWYRLRGKYSLEPKGERIAKRNGEKDGRWGITEIRSLCLLCSSIPGGPKNEGMTTIRCICKWIWNKFYLSK